MGSGSVLVGIDLPESDGGTKTEDEQQAQSLAPPGTLALVRGKSSDGRTVGQVRNALCGREVDLLFIDAEHTEKAALRDFEAYRPLLAYRALVGFHDIMTKQLWPMWNRLRGQIAPVASAEIVRTASQWGCGIGMLVVER